MGVFDDRQWGGPVRADAITPWRYRWLFWCPLPSVPFRYLMEEDPTNPFLLAFALVCTVLTLPVLLWPGATLIAISGIFWTLEAERAQAAIIIDVRLPTETRAHQRPKSSPRRRARRNQPRWNASTSSAAT